jgi:hypothetical protein
VIQERLCWIGHGVSSAVTEIVPPIPPALMVVVTVKR